MKAIVFLSVLLVGALCASSVQDTLLRDVYAQWKLAHKKVYKAGFEDDLRFNIFVKNYMTILSTNQAQSDVVLGLNQFADLTSEEFKAMYTGFLPTQRNFAHVANVTIGDIPARVDWREKGGVTEVKDQKSCGSCWAFSAVGALEGLHFLETGKLESFSEQNLVDCDPKSEGCNGGWMSWAFEYTAKKGIQYEKDYPYTAKTQRCTAKAKKQVKINTSYLNVTAKSADSLKSALAGQPVSVAIRADQAVFQFYKAGVIVAGCGDELNHGVLAVGYDTYTGIEAFIVKNSWGQSWGNKGYVLIGTSEKVNNGNGNCGILADACYPTKFH